MNLEMVLSDIFTVGSVGADIYTIDQSGKPHKQFRTTIYPFKTEMKKANNVILICDCNYNIRHGQISTFDPDNGMQTILF